MKKVAVSSLGVLAFASLALADDTTSGHSGLETMEQPQAQNILQVKPGYTYIAPADSHNTRLGDVKVWRADVPVNYTIKTEPGDLRLGAFYEHSEYLFGDRASGNGNGNFNTLSFDLLWKSMINDEWGYFLYGSAGMSAATDATFSDGLTGIGGAGARYVWSEKLSLGFGAAVGTRMEDDPRLVPIIALNWQIDERWNLRTLNGAIITYDVSGDRTFLLDLGARYQRREYRTDNAFGTTGNGSLTEKIMSLELGATYNFTPSFGLRGFVGVAAGRNFEVRENNDKVTDKDVDSALFLGIRAVFTF